MRKTNGLPAGGVAYRERKIGAGGFSPSLKFANDGTMVCHTDVGGAYKWNPVTAKWDQLCTASRMPVGFQRARDVWEGTGVYLDAYGVFDIAIAPQDSSYIVMMFTGYLFKSVDGGASFTELSGWTRKSARSNNGAQRLSSDKIVIDPLDKTIWYVTTETELYRTADGGTTFTKLTTVPDATGTSSCIVVAIDNSSAATGGHKSIVHAYSAGSGAYKSTDGGLTFAQTKAEASRRPRAIRIDQNGVVYLTTRDAGDSAAIMCRYAAGAWTTSPGTGLSLGDQANVAIDPTNANRVVLMQDSGVAQMSLDGCATWSSGNVWNSGMWQGHVLGGDVPWIIAEVNARNFVGITDIRFHPISNDLYCAMGVGVIKCTFPATYSTTAYIRYTIQSSGIESLVAHHAVSMPGGPMFLLSQDRPCFTSTDPDLFPQTYWNSANTLSDGFDLDYARDDANFVAVLSILGSTVPAYSLSKGADGSWVPFTTQPSTALGGGIAVSNKANIVVFPGQNALPRYTTDGGATWANCTFPAGVPTTGETGWQFGYIDNHRHIVTADKAAGASIFYAYNYGPSSAPTVAGIYKSTDSGANWTKIAASPANIAETGYHAVLRAVPNNAGHLFFTGGPTGAVNTETTDASLMRSTDGGLTWAAVLGNLDTGAAITRHTESIMSFGAVAPGKTYPAIYSLAWVNAVFGLYRSDDNCVTWKLLEDADPTDEITCVCADLNTYGQVVVGFTGNGFVHGAYRKRLVGA